MCDLCIKPPPPLRDRQTTKRERERESTKKVNMEQNSSSLMNTLLLISVYLLTCTAIIYAAASNSADFVHRSCKTTRYPDVCYKSLVSYAPSVKHSPHRLAYAALTVSIDRVRSVSSFVAHMSARPKPNGFVETEGSTEGGAIQDCTDNLKDSIDQLKQSIKEMGHLGRAKASRYAWHLNNVETWVSGALTDETTCLESLSQSAGPKVKAAIRKKVVEAAQVTSNALALVNQLATH
ncbi:Plant invertase/pectin methylesterase inhibitor superfamily protein [Rhynchospora pubera]|uniref:Plant invertase/pectin methylesterase inhibitor superfamily protein n=1 Tax=Rhynchospora pubera TaxID=906938 RepID=A0AAV8CWF1_9POAL|nr:Plant invertase/pectin methylesterase inhibitor superfamily protein [Rhynchospora pubera]